VSGSRKVRSRSDDRGAVAGRKMPLRLMNASGIMIIK